MSDSLEVFRPFLDDPLYGNDKLASDEVSMDRFTRVFGVPSYEHMCHESYLL